MITQALSLMMALYAAIGPGLLLVAALPLTTTALVMVVRAGLGPRTAE